MVLTFAGGDTFHPGPELHLEVLECHVASVVEIGSVFQLGEDFGVAVGPFQGGAAVAAVLEVAVDLKSKQINNL